MSLAFFLVFAYFLKMSTVLINNADMLLFKCDFFRWANLMNENILQKNLSSNFNR